MWLFYGDESNTNLEKGTSFFVYGGVAVPGDKAGLLADAVYESRVKAGLRPEDKLKFDTRARPDGFDLGMYTDLKKNAIALAVEHGGKVIMTFVHQSVAKGAGLDTTLRFGINQACHGFNHLLWQNNDYGLMLFDQFNGIEPHLVELRSKGLDYASQPATNRLQRIVGFHSSSISTSHLASVADVVVGSFRFAVTDRTNANSVQMLRQLQPMCVDEAGLVDDQYICLNPKTLRVAKYQREYDELRAFLKSGGIDLTAR
jgi:hypothetical protein